MTVKTMMVIASEQYKKETVIANWQSATTLDNGWSVWLVAGPVLVEAGRAADQGYWSQLRPRSSTTRTSSLYYNKYRILVPV